MKSMLNRSVFTGVVLGAGLILVLGFGPALAQQAGIKPAVVATVRLQAVMEKLDQQAEATANLNAMGIKVKAEDAQRQDELQKMQDQLEKMHKELGDKEAPPEVEKLQEDAGFKVLQYKAWLRLTQDKVDIEKSIQWQDLYRNIKMAASQMAEANGYDVVLVDDSQGEIRTAPDSRTSRESQVLQQIIGRRTLFVNPKLDITDELITRMNNAHKAAGGAAAAPAPAPDTKAPGKPPAKPSGKP